MDLSLLRALHALLEESSVTRAAERLHTSPAAVSRTLARLRIELGDPLLVRAGRSLTPTPFATTVLAEVDDLIRRADALSQRGARFDPGTSDLVFTVQVADLFLAGISARLLAALREEAPYVGVVFPPESIEGGPGLRDGDVDVEIGVLDHLDMESRSAPLSLVPLVGLARVGHPYFDGPMDAATFAAASHIGVSRRGRRHGPIDDALAAQGLRRRIATVVPSHLAAMLIARASDLIALSPRGWLDDVVADLGLRTFDIPLTLPPLHVGMAWHPRTDADPAHRWFRQRLRDVISDHA